MANRDHREPYRPTLADAGLLVVMTLWAAAAEIGESVLRLGLRQQQASRQSRMGED